VVELKGLLKNMAGKFCENTETIFKKSTDQQQKVTELIQQLLMQHLSLSFWPFLCQKPFL
jgi:hypothetical protein